MPDEDTMGVCEHYDCDEDATHVEEQLDKQAAFCDSHGGPDDGKPDIYTEPVTTDTIHVNPDADLDSVHLDGAVPVEKLRELVAEWRDAVDKSPPGFRTTLTECADELEEVIEEHD